MRLTGSRLATLIVVCTLLMPVPSVVADESRQVSGSYTVLFPPDAPYSAVQRSKNVCSVKMGTQFLLDGDLKGPVDVLVSIILMGPCDGDWSQRAYILGKGSFAGTLGDAAGGFDVTMVAQHEEDYVAHGKWVIKNASGDLAGLHGILNFTGFVGWGGIYQGKVHFAP
jgi:hypothetical protein